MVVLLHVIIALASIAFSGYVFYSPSRAKIQASYGLVGLTLASGTYLVVSTHSPMLQTCITGLVYLGITLSGTFAAHRKLAAEKARSSNS